MRERFSPQREFEIWNLGWKEDRPDETQERLLPEFHIGDKVDIESVFTKGQQTNPPDRFTDGMLLQKMETAGKNSSEIDDTHSGIGTPATRAETIEKLVCGGFVERIGEVGQTKTFAPTELAYLLYEVLPESLRSAELTAEWEAKLSEVEKGTMDPEKFLEQIKDFIKSTLTD